MLYDLCMMQHYGVATRLLDWSRDPLVALFFAVASCSEVDASIYAIGVNGGFLQPDLLTRSLDSVGDVDRIIKFEAPLFDGRVAAQKSVFTIQPFLENEHQYVSLDDRDLIEWDRNECDSYSSTGQLSSFVKVTIPKKAKYNLLAELIAFGVDKSVLFPGLQGIGDSIMDAHKKQLGGVWRM
ncbi:hypothetical protein B9057_07600 [Aestuarium zhoushanense]|nr:hypothetical protein B9057_07600 [Aestuarium zhoushanense]